VAVQGQGAARQIPEPPQFSPPGRRRHRGEDPPVQKLAGGVVEAVAVPHQVQGVLPGITPGQEEAEVGGGVREVGPGCGHTRRHFGVPKRVCTCTNYAAHRRPGRGERHHPGKGGRGHAVPNDVSEFRVMGYSISGEIFKRAIAPPIFQSVASACCFD